MIVFEYSFKFYCDPIPVVDMNAAPNVLIYLMAKLHIFWKPLAISLEFIFDSMLI
jgi:hypothetical protein